ncbi:hypothetical protein QFZ28_002188 [Neobacillus niacini]|jgi:hypothetical protein|nr:hypothetical protein [Neobacillus niacini]
MYLFELFISIEILKYFEEESTLLNTQQKSYTTL